MKVLHNHYLRLLFYGLLLPFLSFSQKESNNWFFGFNAGISFNTASPTVLTGGQINTREGVSTMSNKTTGQLMFYSEGTTVWNKNHAAMPNGTGLQGDFSSTQSSIVIPNPGNSNRFYLFTTALQKGTFFSEVDMLLDGGNGDIVPATKNTQLIAAAESSEKLIAVKHCNGKDYWVITHKLFSNTFMVYLVNAAGVQPPLAQNTGAVLGNATGWEGVGYLKLSADGSKLAHTIGPATSGSLSNVELLSFNNKTGVISGPVVQLTGLDFPYGVEFSLKNKYLYVSETLGRRINQYDLNAANINASKTVIASPATLNFGALQTGPDGKIYCTAENGYNTGYGFTGRINNPELPGAACGYVQDAISLLPGTGLIGLPTFPADFLLKDSAIVTASGNCAGQPVSFSYSGVSNVDSVKWSFGDGSPVSVLAAPAHTYAAAGNFNVQLVLYKSCSKNDTVNKPVTIINCAGGDCSNWLSIPSPGSHVTTGDVDVAGNQLTVEAVFNRVPPVNLGLHFGCIVSKHGDNSDVNYSLRPERCEITTTVTGYTSVNSICHPELDQMYHVAMVYDGATLKFYRNGYLMAQKNCTGNLVTNNWPLTIGQGADPSQQYSTQFLGYVNEVRIWNTARTQTELRSYMNTTLPNPASTPGLQAYYVFNDLVNKQGNAAFNGTISGAGNAATINAINPACTFRPDSCQAPVPAVNCSYWPVFSAGSYTSPIPGGNTMTFSYSDAAKLRGPKAYNTLTPGNVFTPNPTLPTGWPNATFHNPASTGVIEIVPMMTGDEGTISFSNPSATGFYLHVNQTLSSLEFSRSFSFASTDGWMSYAGNGWWASSVLIPNSGAGSPPGGSSATLYFPPGLTQLKFKVNYADPAVPDTVRLGFTFPDNCTAETIGDIINLYTPVLAFDPCKNELTVEDATGYNVGDTVLMIQMKGAVIDSSNTAAFGTITDYKSAGNYEFNYIAAKNGNTITLKNKLLRTYEIPAGKVQLIRVPYFNNVNITGTLTCAPWDGSKGGVLVLNVKDTVVMNSDIDVSGKGFRGGNAVNSNLLNWQPQCGSSYYYAASGATAAQDKGEGIAEVGAARLSGRGPLANGGGGGNLVNTGGGGGSNGGAGGKGGNQYEGCSGGTGNPGLPGNTITLPVIQNKLLGGGGGGAGDANDPGGTFDPDGGNAGGIIIVNSNFIKNNGFGIKSNGAEGKSCSSNCFEGAGGGGAGGTVALQVTGSYLSNLSIEAKGGKGANTQTYGNGNSHGPGGGGGGGTVLFSQPSVPAQVSLSLTGGLSGNTSTGLFLGAAAGSSGLSGNNWSLAFSTALFVKNIDSVRIKDSLTSCFSFDFKGLAFTNTTGIQTWQWFFGDGNTANTQNTTHTYANAGPYTVKLVVTDLNGCKDSITKNINVQLLNFDFSYRLNPCAPLNVRFEDANTGATGTYWSFGDGNTTTNTTNPLHTYASFGNYVVKYSTGNGLCRDTVTKTISIALTPDNTLITTSDTTICKGSSKQLLTKPALSFCWTPATWLNDPLSPTPVATPQQNITYYYTAEVTGPSVVVNGDFNNGNTGFTSGYNFANPNITEGQYFVGPSPQAWNASLSNCPDHTTGTGNMLLVNGSPVNGINVWSQTVAVTPNTNYAFSAWLQALWPPNPAQLQFSINGKNIGQPFTASLPTCTWRQFYYNWNSGPNTTATISIVNRNTQIQGNDFALDDISFAPVFLRRDSVRITLDSAIIRTSNDTTICAGSPVQLNSTGGVSYSWAPPTGLSNPAIGNPVATPLTGTQYIVTGTNANGCQAKDTVNIAVTPLPVVNVTNDTAICLNSSVQLTASGGNTYVWTPAATLSNPNIANPLASPVANTMYYVTVSNSQCSSRDSVAVTIRPKPIFNKPPDRTVCDNATVQLSGNNNPAWQHQWLPAQFLNNTQSAAPTFTPGVTTAYTVRITEPVCGYDSLLNVQVTVTPSPGISAAKSNDIDCTVRTAQLNASGGLTYVWSPATGLSSTTIANPVSSTDTTITYQVTGANAVGCTDTAFVTVAVTSTGKGLFELPSAFTPNGDGINDCFGIKNWGAVEIKEFAVYNRWGERVWSTTNPNQCWNGIYKGVPQPPATFVYYIKAKSPCGDIFRKGTVILIR